MDITAIIPLADSWGMHDGDVGMGWWIIGVPFMLLMMGGMMWLMMRWNEKAEMPGHERYLLAIAYLTGLAFGVHLLALLVVPGVAVLLDSVVRFVRARGTPAPPAPTAATTRPSSTSSARRSSMGPRSPPRSRPTARSW